MFGKDKKGVDYPPVPPSLNHDSVELSNKEQLRPHADTAPGVTPYLGLRARLSQVWFNRWTILLLLVLVRVLLLLASLNDNIGDAKQQALAACTKVEDIGSAMASMPHYLSVGVNSIAADGITKAVSGMVKVLDLILTGVSQLLLFIINMYIGTYVCLVTAFIHGGLDVAVAMVQDTTKFMNDAIKNISGDMSKALEGVQSAIDKAFDLIGKGAAVFGQNIDKPTIDVSKQISSLQGIKVDDTQFVKDLVGVNASIPTFDQAKNLTESVLSIPFKKVQDLLNQTYGNYKFDSSVFPVAQKKGLAFCSDNSFLNDFFEKLFKIARDAKIAFIVVLVVLAVLVCIPQGYYEIRRWRRQQHHARVLTKHGYDPLDVVYIASRPWSATMGIKLSSRFEGRRQLLVRWAVAYATSLPALFVLSLAIAGLVSCLCQFIILRAIQQKAPELASQVGDFTGQVVNTLDNVSVDWANGANSVITNMTDSVNDDVFGWVRTATSAVNDTLTTFEDEINKGLDAVFKDTVLYNTVKNVFACLIGNKIDAVEKGLTWVHDNAKVSFPLFPNDTFSQGAQASVSGDSDLTSFLATPASVTTDDITAAVNKVIDKLYSGLIQEALISTALLMVYIIIILIGVIRSLAGMAVPGRTRAEGGQRYVTGDNLHSSGDSFTGDGRPPLSPRTQNRNNANGWDDVSLDGRDHDAGYYGDEKGTGQVRGGKRGPLSPGHWRTSSHGRFEGPSGS